MDEESYLLEEGGPTTKVRSVTSEYTTGSSETESRLIVKPQKYVPPSPPPQSQQPKYVLNPPEKSANLRTSNGNNSFIKLGGGGGGSGKKSKMKPQMASTPSNSLHRSFVNEPIHRDLSFNDVQQELIKSLRIVPTLKSHVNAKIVAMMESSVENSRHCLRTTLVEFIRSANGIECLSNYDDYVAKYEYVKVKSNTMVISREQLSVDLFKYDQQYLYLSQILLYLSQRKPPITAIIAKTELEIGLKSIYQDDSTIYDDNNENTTSSIDLPDLSRVSSPSVTSNGTTTTATSSKMMIQLLDYMSELMPIKVKKTVYHYTLTVDLALTTPRTVKSSKKEGIVVDMQNVKFTKSNVF